MRWQSQRAAKTQEERQQVSSTDPTSKLYTSTIFDTNAPLPFREQRKCTLFSHPNDGILTFVYCNTGGLPMSWQKKNSKNTKTMVIRIVCLAVAALMIFSVIASAIWY
jgi:hypothetical protein